jgi:hypothetical protein
VKIDLKEVGSFKKIEYRPIRIYTEAPSQAEQIALAIIIDEIKAKYNRWYYKIESPFNTR